jgi:hypothetical protein
MFPSQGAPLVSTTPVVNFPTVTTGGKFSASVNYTGVNMPQVSTGSKFATGFDKLQQLP